MRKTIADCAAQYLREKNASGELCDSWSLDCGMLQPLHDIYDMSLKGDQTRMLPSKIGKRLPKAYRERYAVLNALGETKRGKELFDCNYATKLYPGLVNGVTRYFTLKEEYRNEFE